MGKEGWTTDSDRNGREGLRVREMEGCRGLPRQGRNLVKHGQHGQLGWDLRFGAAEGVWGRVSGKRAGGAVGPLRRKGGESWWNVVLPVGA